MRWIIDDIKSAFAELRRTSTWVVIGALLGFGLLTYAVLFFAFKTDSVLMHLRLTTSACQQLTNGKIIALFCGMIFFAFAVVITFGDIQQYFHYRNRGGHHEARQALIHGVAWGAVALAISIAALVFFNSFCR
jgi:hypothetical protein